MRRNVTLRHAQSAHTIRALRTRATRALHTRIPREMFARAPRTHPSARARARRPPLAIPRLAPPQLAPLRAAAGALLTATGSTHARRCSTGASRMPASISHCCHPRTRGRASSPGEPGTTWASGGSFSRSASSAAAAQPSASAAGAAAGGSTRNSRVHGCVTLSRSAGSGTVSMSCAYAYTGGS